MGKTDGNSDGIFSIFYSDHKKKNNKFESIINPKKGQPILEYDKKLRIKLTQTQSI